MHTHARVESTPWPIKRRGAVSITTPAGSDDAVDADGLVAAATAAETTAAVVRDAESSLGARAEAGACGRREFYEGLLDIRDRRNDAARRQRTALASHDDAREPGSHTRQNFIAWISESGYFFLIDWGARTRLAPERFHPGSNEYV